MAAPRALPWMLACLIASIAVIPLAGAGPLARQGGGVVLTFDDGCASSTFAASALEARGMRGTFYVLGDSARAVQNDCPYLAARSIQELSARGHDVQVHTMSHPDLARIPLADAKREMMDSQATLSNLLGRRLTHFAYPYGSTTPDVSREASKLFSTSRLYYGQFDGMPLDYADASLLSSVGILNTTTAADVGRWLDVARANNVILVIAIHDINDEPETYEVAPTTFFAILDLIAARGDRLYTMSEAFGSTTNVRFHPHGGNKWWTEVSVSGGDAGKILEVEARDTGGEWVGLPYRSWGTFSGSITIEPGHRVAYRVTLTDGRIAESCAFTHPGGACAGVLDAPPPAPAIFRATFHDVRGDAMWVDAEVMGSGAPFDTVDTRVNGGSWSEMTLTSRGTWVKSVFAPSGSTVELRARATDGQSVVSRAYAWPPG